ncbi:ISAs1 family transposase [Burkholderia cepacia]|uniref:ISAs1 family transposase n=1 Tax=Burkholderia cepacia TaxID=292 RepID=UPI00298F6F60|nr:ISAs1 family transposase [Burkholderia cepacia]MDW9243242.1 DDE_Tnp_1-associated family protein [Burkholderia cepacia]
MSIEEAFCSLTDPRSRPSPHDLREILMVALCAILSGADSWVAIRIWGESKLDWLRRYLPWKRGIPSHDTFGRVFAALDPIEFEASFVRWKRGLCPALADEVVAIDDKSVRGSRGTNQRGPIWYRHEPASCQVICLTRKSTRLRRCSVTSTTWPTRHFQSIALNLTARFRPIVRRCAAPSIGACAKQDRPVVAANTAPPSFPTFHHPAAPHPAIFSVWGCHSNVVICGHFGASGAYRSEHPGSAPNSRPTRLCGVCNR